MHNRLLPSSILLSLLAGSPATAEQTLRNQSSQPVHVILMSAKCQGASIHIDANPGLGPDGVQLQAAPVYPAPPPTRPMLRLVRSSRGHSLSSAVESKAPGAWAERVAHPHWASFMDEETNFWGLYVTLRPGGTLVFGASGGPVADADNQVVLKVLPGAVKDPAMEAHTLGGLRITYGAASDSLGHELGHGRDAAPLPFQVLQPDAKDASLRLADPTLPKFCVIL